MARKLKAPDDLAELDQFVQAQEDGMLIPIFHMDKATSLGFSIRVAGPDSDRAAEAKQKMHDDLIARNNLEPLTPSERVAQANRYLARITMGWEPQIRMDGKDLEYNEENAFALYSRFRFIKEQVDNKAGLRDRFLSLSVEDLRTPSESESTEE